LLLLVSPSSFLDGEVTVHGKTYRLSTDRKGDELLNPRLARPIIHVELIEDWDYSCLGGIVLAHFSFRKLLIACNGKLLIALATSYCCPPARPISKGFRPSFIRHQGKGYVLPPNPISYSEREPGWQRRSIFNLIRPRDRGAQPNSFRGFLGQHRRRFKGSSSPWVWEKRLPISLARHLFNVIEAQGLRSTATPFVTPFVYYFLRNRLEARIWV
jgi:hypothetical protein